MDSVTFFKSCNISSEVEFSEVGTAFNQLLSKTFVELSGTDMLGSKAAQ